MHCLRMNLYHSNFLHGKNTQENSGLLGQAPAQNRSDAPGDKYSPPKGEKLLHFISK
jgi:hypothetical protein